MRSRAMPRACSRAISASTWATDSATPAASARLRKSRLTMSYHARIGMPLLMLTGRLGACGNTKRIAGQCGRTSSGTIGAKSWPSAPSPCSQITDHAGTAPVSCSTVSSIACDSKGPGRIMPARAEQTPAVCRLPLLLLLLRPALTSPAVERAEHRSGTGGEEAHVSERSELCAVPLAREERREPAGAARRIASRPLFFFATFFFHEQRKVARTPKGGRKPLILILSLLWLPLIAKSERPGHLRQSDNQKLVNQAIQRQSEKRKLESRAFAPASQERVTSLCSCKEK